MYRKKIISFCIDVGRINDSDKVTERLTTLKNEKLNQKEN